MSRGKLNKQAQLEQVAADIIKDNICPDLAKSATKLVLGAGDSDADIVFIGEAPGRQEDLAGEPFVGASGRFLDEMLQTVGLSRGDVYITNIVKYRPPDNRDPRPEEKRAFWPYLARQLAIIDPKVVVTLGRHSMEFFLPDAKISQVHGRAVLKGIRLSDGNQRDWWIVPLYHPAAALYNGGMRQTLIDDFESVIGLVESQNGEVSK